MDIQFVLGFITAICLVILGVLYLCKRWEKQKVELREHYSRFVHLVEDTKDSFYYLQVYPKEKFLYLSPSTDDVLGEGAAEEAYANPEICFRNVHPDDYEILRNKVEGKVDYSKSIVQRWKGKDEKYHWFDEYATPVYKNGRLVAVQGIMRNIDEKVSLQQKLIYQLNHDKLTGIYNREYFEKKYDEYNEKINVALSIIVCDLDDLKYINDNYGHKAGDQLLRITAQLLNKLLSESITVARIGGDEFVMMVTNTTKLETEQLVDRIFKLINHHNHHSQTPINLSLGHAFIEHSIGNMTKLFSKADKEMYLNKQKRKGIKRGYAIGSLT